MTIEHAFSFLALAALSTWGFAVVEYVATLAFARWPFFVGIPIIYREQRIRPPAPGWITQSPVDLGIVRIKCTSANECLFRTQLKRGVLFRARQFQLKGTITWQGDQAEVRCRVALGEALFIGVWCLGLLTISTITMLQISFLFGLTMLALMGGLATFFGRREFRAQVENADDAFELIGNALLRPAA